MPPKIPAASEPFPADAGPAEIDNAEQDDEGAQAQSVADDARGQRTTSLGLGDSEKVRSTDPAGDDGADVQDLVEHMRQMNSSGRIDMGAYLGERNDDEEEGRYGEAAEDD